MRWLSRKRRPDRDEPPRGMPDLSRFKKPSARYFELHLEAVGQGGNFEDRVAASWGLIARGRESIPFLQMMLSSKNPASREDAAGAFGWLAASDDGIVDELLRQLSVETEDEPRDSIVLALGNLRDRRAIPALAATIRNEASDGDTRVCAVESLGKIVRRRFDRQPDPTTAALAWLDAHDF